jgi:hypothetical protein
MSGPPEDIPKEYLRIFVIIMITLGFFGLIGVKVYLAITGNTAASTAIDPMVTLLTGLFFTVIYFLGIKQGQNGGN